jgi:hypothetical protein
MKASWRHPSSFQRTLCQKMPVAASTPGTKPQGQQSNKWEMHELITQLIFPFKTSFCNLVELAMIQITQNSISSHTIGVKIMKSPSGNPTHQGLSKKTKGALQFP